MTGDAQRLLVLLRHAEAQPYSPAGDLGRDLTPSGRATAAAVGRELAQAGLRPDEVVISPALRTVRTWEALAEGAGWSGVDGEPDVPVRADGACYDASPEALAEAVAATDDDVRVLAVVAHSPGIPALAWSSPRPQDEPGDGRDGWPPATYGVVALDGAWSSFAVGSGELRRVSRPA